VDLEVDRKTVHQVSAFGWRDWLVGLSTFAVGECGLCGGHPIMKDNFKGAVLRLMAQMTARHVKRD